MSNPSVNIFFGFIFFFIGWVAYERITLPFTLSNHQPQEFHSGIPDDVTKYVNNQLFTNARVINNPELLSNPEDLAVDSKGNIYAGLEQGKIVRIDEKNNIVVIGRISTGKIWGLFLTRDEKQLYFISASNGLCRLHLQNKYIDELANSYNGKHLNALNAVTVDEDHGKVYFTQASSLIPMTHVNKQLILKNPLGSVYQYDLHNGKVDLIATGLYMANGIDYDYASRSLLVAELNRYRILRISTEQKTFGEISVAIDNLSGFADNIRLNEQGQLLIAYPSTRDQNSNMADRNPGLRKFFLYLPELALLQLSKKSHAGGVKYNHTTGQVIEYLLGDTTKISYSSTLMEKNGKLYFSSYNSPVIVVVDRTNGRSGSAKVANEL